MSPILAKKKKIPTVETMIGITMGEMINKLIGALSRIFDFTSATAAGTPMIKREGGTHRSDDETVPKGAHPLLGTKDLLIPSEGRTPRVDM